jgi:lysine 2,3-aminomutase
MKKLRGWTSGLAIPQYIYDSHYGKIPLTPDYINNISNNKIILKSYKDNVLEIKNGCLQNVK